MQVGLILRAMGFDNKTRIYLASGELFGGKRFMKPFKAMFPRLENHSTVGPGKLEENTQGLAGSAVDYMVCLLSDIFIPTYDGPNNFANNLMHGPLHVLRFPDHDHHQTGRPLPRYYACQDQNRYGYINNVSISKVHCTHTCHSASGKNK